MKIVIYNKIYNDGFECFNDLDRKNINKLKNI